MWANPDWKTSFPEENISHLARVNSDHCPLLLNLCPNLAYSNNFPFRFQPMWLSHNEFPTIVMDDNHVGAVTRFTLKAQI